MGKDEELTSPDEHIQNTSVRGAILTENKRDWQKDFSTTKAVKDPHGIRKGGEAITSGPVPLRGDREEEGDITGSESIPGE